MLYLYSNLKIYGGDFSETLVTVTWCNTQSSRAPLQEPQTSQCVHVKILDCDKREQNTKITNGLIASGAPSKREKAEEIIECFSPLDNRRHVPIAHFSVFSFKREKLVAMTA